MKMTASEQHLLLELADLELAARIDPAELPERAVLENLRAQSTELRDGAAASSMSVQDIQRRIHTIDEDLKKLSKRQQADADELARHPEDPGLRRELHRDLEQTQRRIDNKLAEKDELLKRCDAQRLNAQHNGAHHSELDDKIAAATRALEAAQRAQEEHAEQRLQQISALRSTLSNTHPDVLASYDQQREDTGIGAARLQGRSCHGCNLILPPATISALRHAPADELPTCPDCGTYLVRT